jgi:hypothetical protein
MRILLIEDEKKTAAFIAKGFVGGWLRRSEPRATAKPGLSWPAIPLST